MSEISNKVKILHIHKASDTHEDFIEFMIIDSGKIYILRENGFISRYGNEAIKKFQK